MLLMFFLLVTVFILALILYGQNKELRQLRQYVSHLESETLLKQIKFDELSKQSASKKENSHDVLFTPLQVFNDRILQNTTDSKLSRHFFGILHLNIQNFSDINQPQSNEKIIIQKIKTIIRKIDSVTHIEDGKFLFLTPQLVKPEVAAYIAQRINKQLSLSFFVDSKEYVLQTHIGISIYPQDGEDLNVLLTHAELACNKAIELKKSFLFYNDTLQKLSEIDDQIAMILRTHDLNQKIITYYVPQVDSYTQKIIGIKMIPHLLDEKIGLFSFDKINKTAEKENKLLTILQISLNEIIPFFKNWRMNESHLERCVININIKQIKDDQFIDLISTLLTSYQLEPSRLVFELESENLLEDVVTMQENCEKLKKLGVQICIGIYTLGHLASQKVGHLPISYLKIDGRAVHNLSLTENKMIFKTLLNLAETMGLKTMVEDIATDEEMIILQKLGIKVMQGPLFGLPQQI